MTIIDSVLIPKAKCIDDTRKSGSITVKWPSWEKPTMKPAIDWNILLPVVWEGEGPIEEKVMNIMNLMNEIEEYNGYE